VKRLGSTNFADMLSGGQMRDVVLEAMAAKASPQAHRIVLFGRCEGNSSPPSHSAHLGAVRSR
jgi:hypothetical protein